MIIGVHKNPHIPSKTGCPTLESRSNLIQHISVHDLTRSIELRGLAFFPQRFEFASWAVPCERASSCTGTSFSQSSRPRSFALSLSSHYALYLEHMCSSIPADHFFVFLVGMLHNFQTFQSWLTLLAG